MQRHSTVQVLQRQFQKLEPEVDPGWLQPPWVNYEIYPEHKLDFVKKNSQWYTKHHPLWIEQFLKYHEYLKNKEKQQYLTQKSEILDQKSSLVQGSNRQSLFLNNGQSRLTSSTSTQFDRFQMKENQNPHIQQGLMGTSKFFNNSTSYPQTIQNQFQYSLTNNQKKLLDNAQEYLKKSRGISTLVEEFNDQAFYGLHRVKISLLVFFIFFMESVLLMGLSRFLPIREFTILNLYVLLQLFGSQILQKQRRYEKLNYCLPLLYILAQTYIIWNLANHFFPINHNEPYYYIIIPYQIFTSFQNLYRINSFKTPRTNKLFQFNNSYFDIVVFATVSQLKILTQIKFFRNSALRCVPIFTIWVFYHMDEQASVVLTFYTFKVELLLFFIFDFVIVQRLNHLVMKIRKYKHIYDLYKSHFQIPKFLYPLILREQNEQLEIESLKFVYSELEQSRKLLFEEKNTLKPQQTQEVLNPQLNSILMAYFHERQISQVLVLTQSMNQLQKNQEELYKLQQTSVFKDVGAFWESLMVRRDIYYLRREIQSNSKFYCLLCEVIFKLLNYNSCGLSQPDLQAEINETTNNYLSFLKSQRSPKALSQTRLKEVICFHGIALSKQVNQEQKVKEFQDLLYA